MFVTLHSRTTALKVSGVTYCPVLIWLDPFKRGKTPNFLCAHFVPQSNNMSTTHLVSTSYTLIPFLNLERSTLQGIYIQQYVYKAS